MKLYRAPQTRSQRAIRMLEEAGIDYEMELVDIRAADRYAPGSLAPAIDDPLRGKFLYWTMRMFDMLPDNRNIGAYADRCMSRPAHRRATEKAAG